MSYVLLECYAMQFIALVDLNVFLSFLLCSFDFECAKSTRNVHLIIHRAVFLHRKCCCYFVQFIFSHYNFSFSNLSCKKASAPLMFWRDKLLCQLVLLLPRINSSVVQFFTHFSLPFHKNYFAFVGREKVLCFADYFIFSVSNRARLVLFFEGSEENLLLLKNLALLERNL